MSCTPRRQQANNLTGSLKVDVKDAPKDKFKYKPPPSLVKSSSGNWVFQPHPDLYKTLAPHVLEQYAAYKSNTNDKSNTPMYFYLGGGAGTGKSRHGSEFASSVQEAIAPYTQHHELAQRLKTAFAFHTSFENGTSLVPEEKSGLYNAVGVRMLTQLLEGMSLDNIRNNYVAKPSDVFRLVAKVEKVDLYDAFTGIWLLTEFNKLLRTWMMG